MTPAAHFNRRLCILQRQSSKPRRRIARSDPMQVQEIRAVLEIHDHIVLADVKMLKKNIITATARQQIVTALPIQPVIAPPARSTYLPHLTGAFHPRLWCGLRLRLRIGLLQRAAVHRKMAFDVA